MNDERITPDEFARLIALPEADPERRRAEATAEFAGMKVMFAAFEADAAAPSSEDGAIRDELARRLATPLPSSSTGRAALPRTAKAPGGSSGWFAALFGPVGLRAVGYAVLVVVAGLGVWTMTRRPREDVVRGEHANAFAITPTVHPGALDLAWPAVAGADAYRVVLLGADLGEVARFDLGDATRWSMRRDSLPAGLASGASISAEVQALQAGAVLSTTPARAIRVP